MQNEQKGPGDQVTVRGSVDLLYVMALCHATAIYPFIRRNFGTEGLGLQALGGLIIMVFCFGCTAEPGMGYMILAWIVALAAHRFQTYKNWATGNLGHSHYAGDSITRFVCKSNKIARLVVEPVLVFGVGWLLDQSETSPVLGLFLMVGAGSLIIVQTFERASLWMRSQKMRDCRIEAQIIAASAKGQDWEG
jgi:hypothetical protein